MKSFESFCNNKNEANASNDYVFQIKVQPIFNNPTPELIKNLLSKSMHVIAVEPISHSVN